MAFMVMCLIWKKYLKKVSENNVHSNRSIENVFGKQTDRFEMDKQWQNQGGQGCKGLPNTERGN